ncbi:hypothetical protein CF54_04065 [Streptomyces sp. Tu 6176]|uniref:hypothetical protein n=1 Tax=Streptomyces sp. Tu 6176 TaxID=1470557 RepID=UPI00044D9A8E|nr:hypothetical protein [Streptomyces sp. Tu 6176]EYT83986.1 hypothetical protein CF54_04065 [Streptomyces sp. Tu 6176]
MFGSKKTNDEKAAAAALRELRLAAGGVGKMMIRKDPLRFTSPGQMDVPVVGATITVDRGEAAKRITATRVALAGPFALLMKKDATRMFLTIEGTDGSAMILGVSASKELAARKLALLVQTKYPAPAAE